MKHFELFDALCIILTGIASFLFLCLALYWKGDGDESFICCLIMHHATLFASVLCMKQTNKD